MSATLHATDDAAHAPVAHGHDDHGHDAPPAGPVDLVKKYDRPELGRTDFTWKEIGWAAGLLGFLAVIFAVVGVFFAAATAGLHYVFREWFHIERVLAANWANGIASVLFCVLVFVMILATLLTMGERKWAAFIQDRMGPNRARLPGLPNAVLWGLPHILADVFKMLTKEEIVPAAANKLLFHMAPALAFVPAFVLFAIVPMSPTFSFFGENIRFMVAAYPTLVNGHIQFVGLDQGLLYLFAFASIAVFGVTLAGWSSNNKYALLGGIRASAQMISYEVTLGLTLVGLMIVFQSLRLDVITEAQGSYIFGFIPAWGVFFQPFAILAYFAAASAEIKRAPFDLPEGESEIVGFFIEYSGLKFGLFMIGEFVEVVVFAGVFTALFFGGYHLPWGEAHIFAWGQKMNHPGLLGLLQLITFMVKVFFFCWLSLTVRWTFPRFRYDHIMNLGWKILLPVSLANVFLTGIVMVQWGRDGAAVFGMLQMIVLLAFVIGGVKLTRVGGESNLPQGDAAAPAPDTHGAASH